jgi:hypothetical protein
MMVFNPREQGARVMQAHVDAGVLREEFHKWKIGVLVGLFEHMAEIAAWLMGVDEQNEMKALRHGDRSLQRHHTVCRKTTDSKRWQDCPRGAPCFDAGGLRRETRSQKIDTFQRV